MDGAGVDDRTARCGQPAETFADSGGGGGAARWVAGADRAEVLQGGADDVYVDRWVQGAQAEWVDVPGGAEEVQRAAVEHCADVDELTAVDAGAARRMT